MSAITYICTNDNLSVFIDGRQHTIPLTDYRIERLQDAIRNGDEDAIRQLVNFKQTVAKISENRIVFDPNTRSLTFNGEPLHNAILNRIVVLFEQNLPIQGHLRFLDRLMNNPSYRAVNELYRFIEACDLPITPDGCFLAYKIVNENYLDCYTNTIDNSIGAKPRVERNQVDDDSTRTCSYGLHACSKEYLPHYGGSNGRVMVVKIDPADVVAVPEDYNNAKLRCCGYEVVSEIPREEALGNKGMDRYHTDSFNSESVEEDLEEEFWDFDYGLDIGVDDSALTPDSPVESGKRGDFRINQLKQLLQEMDNRSKLTEHQVRDIDRLLREGEMSIANIGRLYNVNESTIRKIRDGLTWSRVTGR